MTLEANIKKMSLSMLALRRIQDKTEADFLASLGGLSLPQLNVLNAIGDMEPCTMGSVAKYATLSLSSITLIVDKLVNAKLVLRVRSKTDRRIVHAKLSANGQKIYQIQIEHLARVSERMLAALTSTEQEQLLNILHKLTLGLVPKPAG
jgi:DNA-binding MarR family transcriptional regulator